MPQGARAKRVLSSAQAAEVAPASLWADLNCSELGSRGVRVGGRTAQDAASVLSPLCPICGRRPAELARLVVVKLLRESPIVRHCFGASATEKHKMYRPPVLSPVGASNFPVSSPIRVVRRWAQPLRKSKNGVTGQLTGRPLRA